MGRSTCIASSGNTGGGVECSEPEVFASMFCEPDLCLEGACQSLTSWVLKTMILLASSSCHISSSSLFLLFFLPARFRSRVMQPAQIFIGPPLSGLFSSSSGEGEPPEPEEERRPSSFMDVAEAAARANARWTFAGSCMALVHTSIVYISNISGDLVGVGFAISFGLDIVCVCRWSFVIPNGIGYKVNFMGIWVSTRDLSRTG